MAKHKPFKYTGRLGEGILEKSFGLLADSDAVTSESLRIVHEKHTKLPELCEVHGVAYGDWFSLVMRLAEAHVPGFKVRQKAGRKTDWEEVDKAEFFLDVDAIVKNTAGKKLTLAEAIERACDLPRWYEKTLPLTHAAITKHYYAADPRFIRLVETARAYELIVPTN